MQIKTFNTQDEWIAARLGKITGSRLSSIVVKRGTKTKIGFYELIAERIATPPDGENPMDRGHRLEVEAIEKFCAATEKKVDTSLVMWIREDNQSIAVSPDGYIEDTEAVEVKCLSSAKHIEAYLTKKVPDEYEYQIYQYFIVNDDLETVYMVFYDPRMPEGLSIFWLTINRKDVEEEIAEYLEYQKNTLAEVERIVTELTF